MYYIANGVLKSATDNNLTVTFIAVKHVRHKFLPLFVIACIIPVTNTLCSHTLLSYSYLRFQVASRGSTKLTIGAPTSDCPSNNIRQWMMQLI